MTTDPSHRRRMLPANALRRVQARERAVQRRAIEELQGVHGGLGDERERGEEEREEGEVISN